MNLLLSVLDVSIKCLSLDSSPILELSFLPTFCYFFYFVACIHLGLLPSEMDLKLRFRFAFIF